MTDTAAVRGATALRAKADRLAKNAEGKRDADERRRQADALRAVAGHVERGVEALRTALGPPGSAVDGITAADRERAGAELYALAQRHADKGMHRDVRAAAPDGWVTGGHGLPVHRPTLDESARLYALALALHYESFWHYSQGLLHESMGDFAAAADLLENVGDHYAAFGKEQAARCRRKAAGTWNARAELDAALGPVLDAAGKGGLGGMLGGLLGWLAGKDDDAAAPGPGRPAAGDAATAPLHGAADAPAPDSPATPGLERAERAAQAFAEHLVDGDFAAAQALLARALRDTGADDLRAAWTAMMSAGADDAGDADADAARVAVMGSSADMPGIAPPDLGWVYVAIEADGFGEAVTVVVTEEDGEARIRTLEWGRP